MQFDAPALLWVPGGLGRSVRLDAGARGYRVAFRSEVLAAALGGVPGGSRLRGRLGAIAAVPASRLDAHGDEIAHSFRALARQTRQPTEHSAGIVAAHLALLALHASRLSEPGGTADRATPERAASVARRFLHLLDLHLRDGWSVKRYADALGVTADRLRAVCHSSGGRSPAATIRDRLVVEIRARLRDSDASVEQVAFALGFRDPSYFNRFCRRHLGLPPGRYRRRDREMTTPRPLPGSYAAWP